MILERKRRGLYTEKRVLRVQVITMQLRKHVCKQHVRKQLVAMPKIDLENSRS